MHLTRSVEVKDASHIGEGRRMAQSAARQGGFDEDEIGRIALIATELASNLVKHGGGGQLFVNLLPEQEGGAVEMLAVDKGNGMADVERCMTDGFSSRGTGGVGLGAISRQSTHFQVYSRPGQGTAVLARVAQSGRPASTGTYGAVCLPYPGEAMAGDGFSVRSLADHTLVSVVDGLGHGLLASKAAAEALRTVELQLQADPVMVLDRMHRALRSTRGAAGAAAVIDHAAEKISFAGIGNVSATIVYPDGKTQSLVSLSGILGHEARRLQKFDYRWQQGSLLLVHSDGIATSWRLSQYPGLAASDPSLIAAVLARDFVRGRDDATIVAFKDREQPS